MDEALYLKDSYMKEFDATVAEVKDGKFIILDQTAFYPNSGGQAHDEGVMKRIGDGGGDVSGGEGACKEFKVVFCGKFNGKISHEIAKEGIEVGDKVHCTIDWNRRYKLMRSHTAAHIICEVIHREAGALITGNKLDVEKCRIDFSLEDYDPSKMQGYIDKANEVVEQDLKISVEFTTREKAEKIPQLSKLAMGLPESVKEVRLLKIEDFDIQADGGTHVRSTKEVGKIELIKCENKGKSNRRLYFKLTD